MNEATREDAAENLASTERFGTDRQAKGLLVPVSKYRTFNPGSFVSIREWTESQSHDNLLKQRTGQTEAPQSVLGSNLKRAFISLPQMVARHPASHFFSKPLEPERANVSDPEVPGFLVRPPVFLPIRTLSSISTCKKSSFHTDYKHNLFTGDKLADSCHAEAPETERKSNAFLMPSERNQLLQTHLKSALNAPSSTFTPEFRIDSDLGSIPHSKSRSGMLEPAANLDISKSTHRIDTNIDLAEVLLKEDRFQSFLHSKQARDKKPGEPPVRSLEEAQSFRLKLKREPTGPPNTINSSSASE